ncbi:MAG: hypothetical protein JNL08_01740 [Planctomycetes bacterium]|nr:hypothetical protein [Planctomycetota bacterium]
MVSFRTFVKEGALAQLDFRVDHPADWVSVPAPDAENDFEDPLHVAPIALLMAPYAAIAFAVAARPVYEDGTVAQWLGWMARQRGLDPGGIEAQKLGALDGVACWGMQTDGDAVIRTRLVMCEDGGRVLHLACMAPDALWTSVQATFVRMLESFTLAAPRGRTRQLASDDEPLQANTLAVPAAPAPGRGPLPMPDVDGADAKIEPGEVVAADVALAATMATFAPEHPFNVRMRDTDSGRVPDVLDYHDQERWATLAPATLGATLRVPFGWHVLDDGRRVLVFDADGRTQVHLGLLPREGRADAAILAAKVPDLQRQWPQMRHQRTTVQGRECLLVRDAVLDGAPIEQAYLLQAAPGERVLQVRVTATPSDFRRACDLASVLLRDLRFDTATDG